MTSHITGNLQSVHSPDTVQLSVTVSEYALIKIKKKKGSWRYTGITLGKNSRYKSRDIWNFYGISKFSLIPWILTESITMFHGTLLGNAGVEGRKNSKFSRRRVRTKCVI
jgi:hypothetical protein